MRQALFPGNHADVICSLNNVGAGFAKVGQYTKALESREKALAMQQALFSGNHAEVASSLNNVGVSYYEVG